jgi:hypothetical protein
MRSGPPRVMRTAALREKACLAACPSRIPQFLSQNKTCLLLRLRMRLQRPAIWSLRDSSKRVLLPRAIRGV